MPYNIYLFVKKIMFYLKNNGNYVYLLFFYLFLYSKNIIVKNKKIFSFFIAFIVFIFFNYNILFRYLNI